MEIQKEQTSKYTIQAYSETGIRVNGADHEKSLVLSGNCIDLNWNVNALSQLCEDTLKPILKQDPEIIIIGHAEQGKLPPVSLLQTLSKQRIGFECMSVGAACRTFNILLNEGRRVVLGLILDSV